MQSCMQLGINIQTVLKLILNSNKTSTITYCKTSNISHTLVGNKFVDHSDVVGASPVGAAQTTSSFSTKRLASMDWAKITARWDEKHSSLGIWCILYQMFNINTLYIKKWLHHQMETFSAILAVSAGNSPVTGEFPAQRPVTQSFDIFFDLHLNKRLSNQSWSWCFDRTHYDLTVMNTPLPLCFV